MNIIIRYLAACLFCCLPCIVGAAPGADDVASFKSRLTPPKYKWDGRFSPVLPLLPLASTDLQRYAIRSDTLREIDPGIACDPAAHAVSRIQRKLGNVATVTTTCLPANWSQVMMEFADGTFYLNNCRIGPVQGTLSQMCTGWLNVEEPGKAGT